MYLKIYKFLSLAPSPSERVGVRLFFLFFFTFHISYLTSFSQNTTINASKKNEQLLNSDIIMRSHQILIIPFAPKLYMSEIDKKVHDETKMNFNQIRNTFRTGLDELLFIQFKSMKSSVYALLNDSAKNAQDIERIYGSTTYSYDLVPSENASQKDIGKYQKKDNAPKIVNGQLAVEASTDKKFMNAKITNPQLLGYLNKKYNSSLYVFINELDIKNNPESYDIATNTYKREITVHYTVFDKEGKYVNYGIAATDFSSNINDPDKIIKNYFPVITKTISNRLVAVLAPPTDTKIK